MNILFKEMLTFLDSMTNTLHLLRKNLLHVIKTETSKQTKISFDKEKYHLNPKENKCGVD